jgi:hypothetical protein
MKIQCSVRSSGRQTECRPKAETTFRRAPQRATTYLTTLNPLMRLEEPRAAERH